MPERLHAVLTGLDDATGMLLRTELTHLGYTVDTAAPALAFIAVASMDDSDALLAIAAATCPVVAIVKSDDRRALKAATAAGARGILDLPLRRGAIEAQIAVASAAMGHAQRLEQKIALLERTLKSRRAIERATQVLAAMRGITQADAYEVLRKAAMRKRATMADTAQGYLASMEAAAAEPGVLAGR